MSQTMYDKIGGEAAVKAVVSDFYKRVLADSLLLPFFKNTDMAAQHKHQELFIGMALGGPAIYGGRDMKTAHQGLGITGEAFGAVAKHLTDSLLAAGVAQSNTDQIISTVAALKGDIVEA